MNNPRLKNYLTIKNDPSLAILKYMESMEVQMKAMMDAHMKEMEAKHKTEMKEMIETTKEELKKEIPNYENVLEKLRGVDGADGTDSDAEEVADILFNNPQFIELTKAKDGHTPTSEELFNLIRPLIPTISDEKLLLLIKPLIPALPEVRHGTTPIAGVDYPSKEEFAEMIKGMMPKMDKMKEIKLPTLEEIVKGIEKLPEKQKLDYYKGLKNTPSIPSEKPVRTMARGGGEKVFPYDLSDSCNGILKVFSIPVNKRVLGVFGTDAPSGQYRPVVDWVASGAGNVILTLTDQVAAPQTGATLWIQYST